MKKIKVAEFVGAMNCGGAENMLMNLFRNINLKKYDFTFIFNVKEKCWFEDEIVKLGGHIIRIEKLNLRHIKKYINNLYLLFKRKQFDVVHSHVYLHSGFVMKAAFKANIPIRITHSHSAMFKGDEPFLKVVILRRLINKYATQLVACSKDAGISLFGKKFLKVGILFPNPIDEKKILNVKKNQNDIKIKKTYKINKNEIILGTVGRFVEIKNHKFLILIAEKLKLMNIAFKMFLIGDGVILQDIKNLVKVKKLEKNIIFTGNVNNPYDYMNIFDIFLLPSFYEGLPMVLVEAQSLSKQCIVSTNISKDVALCKKLVNFLDLDLDLWVNKIIDILKNKTQNYNGLEFVITKGYTINTSLKLLEKLYGRIL